MKDLVFTIKFTAADIQKAKLEKALIELSQKTGIRFTPSFVKAEIKRSHESMLRMKQDLKKQMGVE